DPRSPVRLAVGPAATRPACPDVASRLARGTMVGVSVQPTRTIAGAAAGKLAPGDVIDVTVGEVAHGGGCVARLVTPQALVTPAAPATPAAIAAPAPATPAASGHFVLFVRHALPGELVRARVTSTTARFARAEAVEILSAAPERVKPPCP